MLQIEQVRLALPHFEQLDSAVSEDGEATEQELVIETKDKSMMPG